MIQETPTPPADSGQDLAPGPDASIDFGWLKQRNISDKLLLGFGILLVLVGLTGATSLLGLRHTRMGFEQAISCGIEIERLAREVHIELLQARRHEKDFLLRWKEQGIDKAMEYVREHGDAIKRLRARAEEIRVKIRDVAPKPREDVSKRLDELEELTTAYSKGFLAVVDLEKLHGHHDQGIVGEFRSRAHEVEDALESGPGLSDARILLLELRRHEKDYLLRGGSEYVSKVQDVVTRLVDEIRATPSLASAPEIEDALGSYRDAFERLVEVDDMVSTRIESFRGEAHSIEESAKMLAAEGRMVGQQQVGEAQQASSRVRWFIVGAVMVILLCGVVLSYILARSITVPIGLLTVVAQRIGAGELRAKAPVVSGDEVGCLAETFNEMTGRLAQSLDDIEKERETSEKLLRNVLPDPIALRLKKGQETIADQYDEATVLFADIVGFTRISSHLTATEIVSHLNVIFSTFDDLADRHGVEKIKTIGDAYMVASGLPEARSDHAEAVADMALGMRSALKDLQKETPFDLEIRIGICTGPLIAGVIGKKKFIYDLWGDTVNVASRMESHGSPGQIQVSSSTYHCLRDRYVLRERGSIEIKGKGSMDTYFLDGKMPGG